MPSVESFLLQALDLDHGFPPRWTAPEEMPQSQLFKIHLEPTHAPIH